MKDTPFISVFEGVMREAEGESNDWITCERRNVHTKNDMSFSRAPIHARIWPLELSPQTGVISVKITRRAVILGIWRISSLDLILSCSAHNFSRWFMQDQGRCYRLDPRQPEHFWRDSFKCTMYSENATDFTEQRWHWLQVCDGKIRFKDKNE